MKYITIILMFAAVACNNQAPVEKSEQGYRQNQEEATRTNDYTEGTVSYNNPQTRR